MQMNLMLLMIGMIGLVTCEHKNNWAVLVAGSDGWWNYRHQSDIFHTYQTLIKNGYNAEHIIVFAVDDIAKNSENPFPGEVFNHPDPTGLGVNVYQGVVIDYKGNDVTSANYLKVIKGDKAGMAGIGSGRVLESTNEDNVFMFFSDHGSDNLIAFPNDYLYADDLLSALKYMHEKQMYHHLVYYLEACHSGSMFENLPKDLNIYATTASNAHESSYAYYCGIEAKVNGKLIGSCLGDEYSCKWMEDTDAQKSPETYTLKQQYEHVKESTVGSHVMEYGDLTIGLSETIQQFHYHRNQGNFINRNLPSYEGSAIPSRMVKLHYLKQKELLSNSIFDKIAYEKEIKMVARSKKIFDIFKTELNIPDRRESHDIDFDCLKFSVEAYKDLCGLDERDIEFINAFTTACSINTKLLNIYTTLRDICKTI